jgi:hydrogenase-4 component B
MFMLGPMWLLAACCVLVGVFPAVALGVLDRAVATWAPLAGEGRPALAGYVPYGWLTVAGVALIVLLAIGGVWITGSRSRRITRRASTWGCGYAQPTPRIQYTGSSFSQMLVGLLGWVLWPRTMLPRLGGIFAKRAEFMTEVPDVVLDRGLLPAFGVGEWLFGFARFIQRGPVHAYLLYVLGILLLLLLLA